VHVTLRGLREGDILLNLLIFPTSDITPQLLREVHLHLTSKIDRWAYRRSGNQLTKGTLKVMGSAV
jgi:hypothetical protein